MDLYEWEKHHTDIGLPQVQARPRILAVIDFLDSNLICLHINPLHIFVVTYRYLWNRYFQAPGNVGDLLSILFHIHQFKKKYL